MVTKYSCYKNVYFSGLFSNSVTQQTIDAPCVICERPFEIM